jgi:hypothetical protein
MSNQTQNTIEEITGVLYALGGCTSSYDEECTFHDAHKKDWWGWRASAQKILDIINEGYTPNTSNTREVEDFVQDFRRLAMEKCLAKELESVVSVLDLLNEHERGYKARKRKEQENE